MIAPEQPLPDSAPVHPPQKSTARSFLEDCTVSGFGMATSAAVAYGSHFMAANWDFAPFTWMVNFVIPVGALLCGFVAATGYWIGARLFNHRPTRMLMLHILVISLGTFFSIHQLDYSAAKYHGVSISDRMSFPDYLVAVTEHMRYKSSNSYDKDEATELGKWGWGVAALQVLGFSLGGLGVYGMLASVPYCDRCAKYLSEKKHKSVSWKDKETMHGNFAVLSTLMQAGHLQEAIDQHATMGDNKRFGAKAFLHLELRKCPTCENRRLRLTATQRNGNQVQNVGQVVVPTEEPLRMATGKREPELQES